MSPEVWQRLMPLFEKALDLPPGEREALIAGVRLEQAELGEGLSSLLRGHEEGTWHLDRPAITARDLLCAPESPFSTGSKVLGRFRIIRLLGSGGMGDVYEAHDAELGPVALKTIRPEIASSADVLARFKREVMLARRINSPYVCRIHELFFLPAARSRVPSAFLTMEFLEGITLADRIQNDGPLPWKAASSLALQLTRGLGSIHAADVIHRDLKSRNIMLVRRDGSAQPVIMDFGLASATADSASATRSMAEPVEGAAGTPEYMAPEQFDSGPVSPATDIFALGVVLYEAVTGVLPFSASSVLGTAVRRGKRPVMPSSLVRGVPRRCDRIISRCLEFEPANRFQSAHEVAEALQYRIVTKNDLRRTVNFTRRHAPLAVTAVAGFVAALGAGSYWLRQNQYHPPAENAQRWYAEGVSALRQGTYLKAVNALKQALAIDSRFALAHARLADAYDELDYYGEAKDELLRAYAPAQLQNLPSIEKQRLDAVRAGVLHDFPAAARLYGTVLQRTPKQERPLAYLDLGRALEKEGDLTGAMSSYRAAAKIAVDEPAAFVRLGILEGRQNHTAQAESSFATAEALYRSGSNYEGLAEIAYQRGDIAASNLKFDQARTLLAAARDFAKTYSSQLEDRALCRLSWVEHIDRNDAGAEDYANQAVAVSAHEGLEYWATEAQCRLASAYTYKKGRLPEADRAAANALQTAQRNHWPLLAADAQMTLSIIRNRQERPSEAKELAQAALGYYSQAGYFTDSTRALTLMIRSERDHGDFEDAVKLCQEGVDLEKKSGSPPVMIQLEEAVGSVYSALERFPQALNRFQTAATLARDNARKFLPYETIWVADTLWRLGRYHEAEDRLNSVAATANGDDYLLSSVHATFAEMRASQGRWREAIHSASRSRALDPGSPQPNLDLVDASAYFALGKQQKALQSSARAVAAAERAGDTLLAAHAKLVRASLLIRSGNALEAKSLAETSLAAFSKLDCPESKWQSLATLSQVAARLNGQQAAGQYPAQVKAVLSDLQRSWGDSVFSLYLSRPDIHSRIPDPRTEVSFSNRRMK